MLVLTRKTKEGILISLPDGTEVRIEVLDIKAGRVRLGFDAPRDCRIKREELQPEFNELCESFAYQAAN
jgi:carbon storage regulator CsrA